MWILQIKADPPDKSAKKELFFFSSSFGQQLKDVDAFLLSYERYILRMRGRFPVV